MRHLPLRPSSPCFPRERQKGVALFIVIVLVLLSMLLALWASRSALFSEMVVGNDADYQRAFEAAQALLQDAELDIRREKAKGAPCNPGLGAPGFPPSLSICRNDSSLAWLPEEAKDIAPLLADLAQQSPVPCRNGLCAKRIGPQDFWNNTRSSKGATLEQMAAYGIGARYGEFTGAFSSGLTLPLLTERRAGKGGWYWIEVLPHDPNAGNTGLVANGSQHLALHMVPQVAYRITAVVHGLKPGTLVVLQQSYARQRLKN